MSYGATDDYGVQGRRESRRTSTTCTRRSLAPARPRSRKADLPLRRPRLPPHRRARARREGNLAPGSGRKRLPRRSLHPRRGKAQGRRGSDNASGAARISRPRGRLRRAAAWAPSATLPYRARSRCQASTAAGSRSRQLSSTASRDFWRFCRSPISSARRAAPAGSRSAHRHGRGGERGIALGDGARVARSGRRALRRCE